jgi:hypothetical protein
LMLSPRPLSKPKQLKRKSLNRRWKAVTKVIALYR